MFKERLKKTGKAIGKFLSLIVVYIAIVLLCMIDPIGTILTWVVGAIVALLAIVFIITFVYWLFVEPFRGKR